MKKTLLSLLIISLFWIQIQAQTNLKESVNVVEGRKCGFTATELNTTKKVKGTRSINNVVTIPVHVIVVHLSSEAIGQGRNISEAQILSQFPVLNQDFRRLNPDTSNTPAEFQSIAADCMIEFCLADIDPDGNPTNGITRYADDSQIVQENYLDQTIKPATFWDPTHYLNIWVARIFDDGYAYMPSDGIPPYMDGVVVKDIYFGTTGSASPPFHLGHLSTHEIGHWLGLHHTWGPFSGCQIGDAVDDTPEQENFYWGCPQFPQSSCGSNDMYMNYMDYADDVCLNIFTEGQKERMHQTIIDGRPELLDPYGCSFLMGEQTVQDKETVKVYPNPTSFSLQINYSGKENLELKIFNSQGILIKKEKLENNTSIINTSKLPKGVYLFSFFEKNQNMINKKILITD